MKKAFEISLDFYRQSHKMMVGSKAPNDDIYGDSTMKLTILGTGNAMVTNCYNTCFAIQDSNHCFLVDGGGGNGILKQLANAGIDWHQVTDIFVTHKHIDHILGIIWMIRLFGQNISRGTFDGDVRIYGHREVIQLLKDMADMLLVKKQTAPIGRKIHLIPVEDGGQARILEKTVTFFDIQSTKAKQFGFSMELENGEKLTCCGDEPYNPCEAPYAENSKWLLHEAFCLHSQADEFKPYEKHHSTVRDACQLAQSLGVSNLILYHTEDRNLANRKSLYYEEGSRYYSGNLYIPEDLESFVL